MDPEACLRRADQAVSDLFLDEAAEALADYWRWRDRGGFEPHDVAHSGKRGDAFAREVQRRLCDALID